MNSCDRCLIGTLINRRDYYGAYIDCTACGAHTYPGYTPPPYASVPKAIRLPHLPFDANSRKKGHAHD